jgi:glycosyltransferase involved in cell wall biosynthesis
MTPPLVSVILPTFNRAGHLPAAVRSVLDQSVRDLELIVVDGGSTDGTLDFLAGLGDARVRVLQQPGRGVLEARNLGIRASRGRWIAFQDSDDEWLPGKLAKQLETLALNGDAAWTWSDLILHVQDGKDRMIVSPPARTGQVASEDGMSYATADIWLPTCVIRRDCLEQVRSFDEGMPPFLEDLELLLRINLVCEGIRLAEPLVRQNEHAGPRLSRDLVAMARARLFVLHKHGRLLRPYRGLRARQLLDAAFGFQAGGFHAKAAWSTMRAFGLRPLLVLRTIARRWSRGRLSA